MDEQLPWVQPIIQLATAGGFGALVWYLIIKYLPAIDDRHRSERSDWLKYIQDRDDRYDRFSNEVRDELRKLNERIYDHRRD